MLAKALLEVDLGANGIKTFGSIEEVKELIDNEFLRWSWLSNPPVADHVSSVWSFVRSQLQPTRALIGKIGESNPNNINQLSSMLEQAFRNNRMPLSSSPVGQFIIQLSQEEPLAAAAALGSWLGQTINLSNFAQLKGAFLMAAFDSEITKKTPAAVKRSLEDLRQKYYDAGLKTQKETEEQRETFKTERFRQRRTLISMMKRARHHGMVFANKQQAEIHHLSATLAQNSEAAISELKATEKLYKEHMRLKGPVEYWTQKATTHRAAALSFRRWLVGFSVFAGIGLLLALYWIGDHAVEVASADKPPAVYLVLVTLGVVLTTMVFWAARILTRLFLSEHHLAIDAEERAVMTQTYLALTAEGQAQENERSIVLSALFRPTADGIVKDDAAPDISPAALLSKLGSR